MQSRKYKSDWERNRFNTCPEYRERRLKNIKEYKRRAKQKAREWIESYKKDCKCSVCGFDDDWRCLDFHHKNPKLKKMSVTRMVSEGRAIKSIKEEIDKCETICANCHRLIHWDELKKGLNKRSSKSKIKFIN